MNGRIILIALGGIILQKLVVIRHCEAEGQAPTANLTHSGQYQAKELVKFLEGMPIKKIISSPFNRAVQSILPFANKQNMPIEIDDRLMERVLSSENLVDWQEKLKQSFHDENLKLTGGESSREAASRVVELVEQLLQENEHTIALITHGNLMTLLLKHFSPTEFGFEQWKQLSNPDVYLIEKNEEIEIKRIWNPSGSLKM